jgi:hypothetical protein
MIVADLRHARYSSNASLRSKIALERKLLMKPHKESPLRRLLLQAKK